jgi:hypothetical protein
MTEPRVIRGPLNTLEWTALIECPDCQRKAWIDREQYEGKISIVCECGWHETHDLTGKTGDPNIARAT